MVLSANAYTRILLVALLIVAVAVPITSAAPAFNFNDTFESAITKGVINASTPFSTLAAGDTFGSVYKEGSTYYMFFVNTSKDIYVRNSTDGVTWGENTLALARYGGSWQASKVYCPIVWKEGSTYYMIYTGLDSSDVGAVGLATSDLPDRNYTRYSTTNPIYQNVYPNNWSYVGAEAWGLQKIGGTYYLWVNNFGGYGGSGVGERQLGLITSTDLHTWVADSRNPIFVGQRFCPAMFTVGSYYYLMVVHQYEGSNYAQIELYQDTNPHFYSTSRKYMGNVLNTLRNTTSGYGVDLDTPVPVLTDVSLNITEDPIPFYYATYGTTWGMGKFALAQAALTDGTLYPDIFSQTNEPIMNISRSTVQSHGGSYSLLFDVSTAGSYYRVFPNLVSGNISFWAYQGAGTSKNLSIYLHSDRNAEIGYFQLGKNLKLGYKNGTGSGVVDGTLVRTATGWYNVLIHVNTTAGTMGYTISNVSGVQETISPINLEVTGSKINSVTLYRASSTSTPIYYLDDLQINGDQTDITPIASFTKSRPAVVIPQTLSVNDTSSNTPTSWDWGWGDGTANATTVNATHTYTVPGNYTITLTVANAAGSDDATDYINVYNNLTAAFTATVVSGSTIQFTNTSEGYAPNKTWAYNSHQTPGWTAFSTAENPTYLFSQGVYDINLTIDNGPGQSDSELKPSYITVGVGGTDVDDPSAARGEDIRQSYRVDHDIDFATMHLIWLLPALIGIALCIMAMTGKETDYAMLTAGLVSCAIALIIILVVFGLMPVIGGAIEG